MNKKNILLTHFSSGYLAPSHALPRVTINEMEIFTPHTAISFEKGIYGSAQFECGYIVEGIYDDKKLKVEKVDINIIIFGKERDIKNLFMDIKSEVIPITDIYRKYRGTMLTQVANEESYRWIATYFRDQGVRVLGLINDLATHTHILKTKKIINYLQEEEIFNKLVKNSANDYAFKKGYSHAISNRSNLTYNFERTQKFGIITETDILYLKFTNKLNITSFANVFIGKNGSGKTYHLTNFLKNHFAPYEKKINFGDTVFSRVITISNTTHDQCYRPYSISKNPELRANYHFISNCNNRYYNNLHPRGKKLTIADCIEGIIDRDYSREGAFSKSELLDEAIKILNLSFLIRITFIDKTVEFSSINEIYKYFSTRRKNNDATNNYNSKFILKSEIDFFTSNNPTSLSSGQNNYLLNIFSLIMLLETNCLLIIEEPENFLHPSLTINFLRILNKTLDVSNSVALISSHSPLVLREVPAEQVSIFNRIDGITSIRKPSIETFAADCNQLNLEVFGDLENTASYREKLDDISNSKLSKKEIIEKYKELPARALSQIILGKSK